MIMLITHFDSDRNSVIYYKILVNSATSLSYLPSRSHNPLKTSLN